MNNNELALLIVDVSLNYLKLLHDMITRRKKFRRWWSKPRIRYNYLNGYGSYGRIFCYFKLNDEEEFINFTRMPIEAFEVLFQLVEEMLTKRSRRPPLPPELRLSATLNYLAHGDSMKSSTWFNDIGLSTIEGIIPEVCSVLCDVLIPLCLRFPSQQDFESIADGFLNNLHFPNCIGAIDGRHCRIKQPPNTGSSFWNYKKFYSIVLMACCDSERRFIWANIGDFGSLNDAGIFANSDLGVALSNGRINLPPPRHFPGTDVGCPYFLIGDGGFPLKKYLMKPYLRGDNQTIPQKAFNYRLSHARQIIEGAFGKLSQQWLVNETTLSWKVSTSERIVMSTVCLHNFLIDFEADDMHRVYGVRIDDDQNNGNNGLFINELEAFRLRDQLSRYLVSPEGSVPWQWDRL